MPKAKKPTKKKAEKSQSERFKETARTLEVDESGASFNAFVAKLLKPISGRKTKSAHSDGKEPQ